MNYNEDEMHKDPKNWKWGVIYFNLDDDRVLVLKRTPAFGMTLNFGNPYIGRAFAVVIILMLLMGILSKVL